MVPRHGCDNYMCGKRNILVELDKSVSEDIFFGDDSKILMKGRSKILIQLKNGATNLFPMLTTF